VWSWYVVKLRQGRFFSDDFQALNSVLFAATYKMGQLLTFLFSRCIALISFEQPSTGSDRIYGKSPLSI
jgi:hypothetical protein